MKTKFAACLPWSINVCLSAPPWRTHVFSLAALYALGQSIPFKPLPQNSSKAAIRFQRLPLAFEPNVGQAAAGTDYLARAGSMQAELSATGMRLSLPSSGGQEKQVSIYLEGARKDGTPNPADKLEGESNYLLSPDASNWHKHIAQYGRVTYPRVYRGVDLTYYGNESELEHEFIVHPGVTPSSIRLQLKGAHKIDITRSGNLRMVRPASVLLVEARILHDPDARF